MKLEDTVANMVELQDNPPTMPASLVGASSCSTSSISYPVLYLWPRRAAGDGSRHLAKAPSWKTQNTSLATGFR